MGRPGATAPNAGQYWESRTGGYVGFGTLAAHLTDTSDFDTALVLAIVATVAVASMSFLFLRRRGDSGVTDDGSVAEERSVKEPPGHGGREAMDDYEVVRRAIRARGGRTRQSIVVEETGWSKAKVSSVLATMEEEGAISKLRVGRENLVSLPGHEPDAVESALED